MALTPQMIQAMNQAVGGNVSPDGTPAVASRANEIRALAKNAQEQKSSAETEQNVSSVQDVARTASVIPTPFSPALSIAGNPEAAKMAAGGFDAGKKAVGEIVDMFKNNNSKDLGSEVATGADLAGKITGLPFAVAGGALGAVIPQDIKDKAGETLRGVSDAIKSNPEASAALEQVNKLVQEHPHLAQLFGGLFSTALNIGGAGVGKAGAEAVGEVLPQVAKEGGELAKSMVPKVGGGAKIDPLQQAIKDVTPSYHPSLIGEGNPMVEVKQADGSTKLVPRIQEGGGVTKKRIVVSSPKEIEAGTEAYKIPGFSEAKTKLEKFNLIPDAIAKEAQTMKASLKAEKILRPPQEIKKIVRDAVNTASKDSLLLQKSDPIVKNYMRVAERAIAKSDGTLDGELRVRDLLDKAYDDAGGKYNNNKGLDQIHRAARNALNDDVESKALNTEVKASLKRQRNLYNAMDVLQDEARKEGGSALEQFMKKHPIGTKFGKAAAKTAGLGAGIHLIP